MAEPRNNKSTKLSKGKFSYDFESENDADSVGESSSIDVDMEIQAEVLNYLKSPCAKDVNCVDEIKSMKYLRNVFIKYNTPVPSSAPVERLFSFASTFTFYEIMMYPVAQTY